MKRSLFERWLAGFLAVVMIAGLIQLPQPVKAAGRKPKDDNLTLFDELGFDTSAPEGYHEEEPITDTPYGREFVSMNEVDELMILSRNGTVEYFGWDEAVIPLQNADGSYFADDSRKKTFITDYVLTTEDPRKGHMEPQASIVLEGNFSEANHGKRANMISVGLQPLTYNYPNDSWVYANINVSAIGRYVDEVPSGLRTKENASKLIFGTLDDHIRIGNQNDAKTQSTPGVNENGGAPGQFDDAFNAYNYLKAAVGDFDADGIDEIAWYMPEVGNPRIEIWDLQNSSPAGEQETEYFLQAKNWKLAQVFKLDARESQVPNMVSLVSGDFDRDGIDDLAVSWGILYEPIEETTKSQAAVLWGSRLNEEQGSSMLASVTELPMQTSDGSDLARVSFTVGDADGDDQNDLVLGGSVLNQGPLTRYLSGYKWNGREFVRFMEKSIDLLAKNDQGKYIFDLERGGSGDHNPADQYYSGIQAPANVAVGDFFGPGQAPAIYLDSLMIANTSDGLKLVDVLTPDQVNAGNQFVGRDYAYVERGARAATLGTGGSDSLVMVAQYYFDRLEDKPLPQSDYAQGHCITDGMVSFGLYKGRDNYDKENHRTLNVFSYSYSNSAQQGALASSDRVCQKVSDQVQDANLCFALPDVDDDTMFMQYTGVHFYRYADPEVVAVLASPPYFEDLTRIDSEMDDSPMVESSTKYAASTGSGSGNAVMGGFSAGIYVGMEHKVKLFGLIPATHEMELEINNHFTWETANMSEVNYQITYENAIGRDGVVLCAMPVETYVYMAYAPDGEGGYQETEITVNIPYEPSVRVIELSQYQKIYEEYKEILPRIDDQVLSHTLGDPRSYPSSLSDLPASWQVMSYPGDPSEIGQGAKSSITQSIEMTHEHSKSFNYEFELNFKTGGGIGAYKAGVSAGITAGSGTVSVSTCGSTYEATMQALPSIAADYGYSFNWRLVGFLYSDSIIPSPLAKQYPVVTYLVTSERVPPHLPDNFTVNEEATTSDSIQLEWDYAGAAAGFVIYRYFESTAGSDYYEIASVGVNESTPNPDGSNHYTYVDRGLAPDSPFSYRIQTIGNAMPNLSVPSGSLHTFTKPLNHPVLKVTEDHLMAYPDNEVTTTAYVQNAGSGSFEYSWQKLVNGQWKTLSAVANPALSGLNTNTMTISFANASDGGEYRCQVVQRTSQSKILKAYSPVVTVDFNRRTAVTDGPITINEDGSISMRLKGQESTSLPSGNVTFTLTRDNTDLQYTVPVSPNGEARLEGLHLDPGVYSVSAYYGGNRVFMPFTCAPDPILLYATGFTGTSNYVDIRKTYTYGDPLNIVRYTVDESGRVLKAEALDTLEASSLEVFYGGQFTPISSALSASAQQRLTGAQAGWAGQYRLTLDGVQYLFSVDPLTVTLKGLKPAYMVTQDQVDPLSSFMDDIRSKLYMNPQAPYEEHDQVLENWMKVLDRSEGFLSEADAVQPGHYAIEANPGDLGFDYLNNNYHVECGTADLVVTGAAHKLTLGVYKDDATRGSIRAINPRNAQHATAGQTVLLEAIPNPGFEVDYWMLNGSKIEGSDEKLTLGFIQGNTDSHVVVRFRFRQNTLTLMALPENPTVDGEAVSNTILTDDDLFFNGSPCAAGYTINLTPQAAEGWHFEKWEYLEKDKPVQYIDTPALEVTMPNGSVIVRAIFVRDSYTLTLGEQLQAFDSEDQPLSDLQGIIGDTVITVRPKPGFNKTEKNAAWIIGGKTSNQTGDSCTFTLLKDTKVEVPITAGTFQVSVRAEGLEGGTASVKPAGKVTAGTEVTFTAVPNRDYVFCNWDFGGGRTVEDNPCTMTVDGELNAAPVFGPREGKTIHVPDNVDWNIDGLTPQPDYGRAPRFYPEESLTLTAYPKDGEIVSGWTLNGRYIPHPGGQLTLTYEEAADGMEIYPNFQPSTMVKITAVTPGITMTLDGEPVESGDYVGICSQVVCTYQQPDDGTFAPPAYVQQWLVNGKPVPGAKSETLTVTVNQPTTVEVKTSDETVDVWLRGASRDDGYYDWSLEFDHAVSHPYEDYWVVLAGSAMAFKAKLKPEYAGLYAEDAESFRKEGFVPKDGGWIRYEENLQRNEYSGNYQVDFPLFGMCHRIEHLEIVPAAHGKVTVDNDIYIPRFPEGNEEMIITAVPDAGYQLQSIELTFWDEKNGEQCTREIVLKEDGTMASKVVEDDNCVPKTAQLKATFCPDTAQNVSQIILPHYGYQLQSEDEVYKPGCLILPENHVEAKIEWCETDNDSQNIIIGEDGTIRAKPDFNYNNLYGGSYCVRATNPDGSVVEKRNSVRIPPIAGRQVVQIAAPGHVEVLLEENLTELAKGTTCRFESDQTIGLVFQPGYELDQIEIHTIKTHRPVEAKPAKRSGSNPNAAYYTFEVDYSDLMIVITEKAVNGGPAEQPYDILCDNTDEHMSAHWVHEKAYAGEEIRLATNLRLEEGGGYNDLIPAVGYELDAEKTTVVGKTTGKAVKLTLNDHNELCFIMPEEAVTVKPVSKTWTADPRIQVTVENGMVNGKRSDLIFKGQEFKLEADAASAGMTFSKWEADKYAALEDARAMQTTGSGVKEDVTITAVYRTAFPPEEVEQKIEYRLFVRGGTGSGTYGVGETLQIQANIPAGKLFKRWYAEGIELPDCTKPNLTIQMPEGDVYLNAALMDAPENVYNLTVVNGTGSGNYTAGERVTVRAVPPAGMVFKTWIAEGLTLTDAEKNNGTLVFQMPENNVVLKPVFEKTSYTVQVLGGEGDGSYHPGDLITVKADSNSGLTFTHWTAEGIRLDDPAAPVLTFRMPANNVALTAHFEEAHTACASVVFKIKNGAWADGTTADKTVEVPLYRGKGTLSANLVPAGMTPKQGYEGGRWDRLPNTAEDGITEDVTYTYSFRKKIEKSPFKDVAKNDWFYDQVLWAVDEKITEGFADDTFRPNENCTRAQVVTFLWRAMGSPKPNSTDNPFKDVKTGAWYYTAVLWAAENGIVEGFSDGTFKPGATCTRAQTVAFLYRSQGEPAVENAENPFWDLTPGWRMKPVLWAAENGIATGFADGSFRPNSICSRAQVVTFLYRAFR